MQGNKNAFGAISSNEGSVGFDSLNRSLGISFLWNDPQYIVVGSRLIQDDNTLVEIKSNITSISVSDTNLHDVVIEFDPVVNALVAYIDGELVLNASPPDLSQILPASVTFGFTSQGDGTRFAQVALNTGIVSPLGNPNADIKFVVFNTNPEVYLLLF